MKEITKILLVLVGAIVVGVLFSLLMGFPVKWLWNWIMPDFGLPQITFWKAWGLMFLSSVLFKSSTTSSK